MGMKSQLMCHVATDKLYFNLSFESDTFRDSWGDFHSLFGSFTVLLSYAASQLYPGASQHFLGNFILAFNALPWEILKWAALQTISSTQDTIKDRLDSTTLVTCLRMSESRFSTAQFSLLELKMQLKDGSLHFHIQLLQWASDPADFLRGPIFSVRRNNDKKGTDLVRHCSLTLQTAHIRQGWEGLRNVVMTSGFCYFVCQTWGGGCWYELDRKCNVIAELCGVEFGHLPTSLALKWNQLSFRMRNWRTCYLYQVFRQRFSHLVLGINPGPKEAT